MNLPCPRAGLDGTYNVKLCPPPLFCRKWTSSESKHSSPSLSDWAIRRTPSKLSRAPKSDRSTTTGVQVPFRTIGPVNEGNPTRVTVSSISALTVAAEPRARNRLSTTIGLPRSNGIATAHSVLMLSSDLVHNKPRRRATRLAGRMTSLRERPILHRLPNRDNLADGPPAEDYDDRPVPTVILTISREVSSPGAVNRRIEAFAQKKGLPAKQAPFDWIPRIRDSRRL